MHVYTRIMRSIIALGAVLLIVPAALLVAAGFREGPLPAMTGGFGEKTCHTCHFDNRENAPGGSLRVGSPLPLPAAAIR